MPSFCRTLLISILLIFSGCASEIALINPNTEAEKSNGILLTSITSDDSHQLFDAWFFYRPKGTKEEIRLDAFEGAGLLMKPSDFSRNENRSGRLIATSLKPGEYELFNWTLYVNRLGGYGYISPRNPPPPQTFNIQPGEITYLGNLHVSTIMKDGPFGFPMIFGGNPNFSDQSEKDFEILRKKFPNIVEWPIIFTVPNDEKWNTVE